MRDLSLNDVMAFICLGLGVSTSIWGIYKYELLQTVCLLLGFIGYGVFNVLSLMVKREGLSLHRSGTKALAETRHTETPER